MKTRLATLCLTVLSLGGLSVGSAADSPSAAAQAVNALGLDLLAKGPDANANTLLSPYSIQAALAMTYAGAAGDTRSEMARVLHYPADEAALHQSFASLQKALDEVTQSTTERAETGRTLGRTSEPIILTVANRLFAQQGYDFRQPFLDLVKDSYGAPLQLMDFVNKAPQERLKINAWVEEQTHQRIRALIPEGGVDNKTGLVLVNAIYMKAPWAVPFKPVATQQLPFAVRGQQSVNVPTMHRTGTMGYAKRDGYQVVTVPYTGGELQLLVLLPYARDGLGALEPQITRISQIMNRLGNHYPLQEMNHRVLRQSAKSA